MAKQTLYIPDYIEQGLHTTEVTRAITEEFIEIADGEMLPRCHPRVALALLGLAFFPPFRWLMQLFGPKRDLFAVIMKGPTYLVYNAPYFLLGRGKRSAWITDTWPNRDKRLLLLVKLLRLNPVFVSYKESAERLKKLAPSIQWIYVPEALPRDHYPAKPAEEREWDLITYGRKYLKHHTALKEANKDGRIRYLFRDDGIPVAKTHQDLLNALGNSRISICVPRGTTHDHSGGVDAMTIRYLQGTACKGLILGQTPKEMQALFGYDPVVQADLDDPAGQLHRILEDWPTYQALIDRNYAELRRGHQWSRRAEFIVGTLRDEYGFTISAKVKANLPKTAYD